MLRIAFILVVLGVCRAQSMPEADRAFVAAVARADKLALERLLDADFTWTEFNGNAHTKAQVLRDLPRPAISNEASAQIKTYSYGDIGDVQVNLDRAHVLRIWVKDVAGWKAIVYQEVQALEAAPTVTPSAASDCENPCKSIPYKPNSETERQVVAAYSKLETAAMARNSAEFATMVGDEFVAASSNSNKVSDKRGRMDDFDHSKTSGVAPTPLTSARMFDYGDAVLMRSEHTPVHGKPLHVTRIWVKRGGSWVETLSYQTSIRKP